MTLVLHNDSSNAGTHALIIGVGGYHNLAKIGFQTAASSAGELWRWLITHFNNPNAQLASIEVLASAPGLTSLEQIGHGQVASAQRSADYQPTHEAVRAAMAGWTKRAASHPENIAILYFGGLGYSADGNSYLLLDDAGRGDLTERGAVSIPALSAALAGRGARRYLHLWDLYSVSRRFLRDLGQNEIVSGAPVAPLLTADSPTIRPAGIAIRAASAIVGPGDIQPKALPVTALVESLDAPSRSTGWVNSSDLEMMMPEHLQRIYVADPTAPRRGSPELAFDVSGDFLVHLPRTKAGRQPNPRLISEDADRREDEDKRAASPATQDNHPRTGTPRGTRRKAAKPPATASRKAPKSAGETAVPPPAVTWNEARTYRLSHEIDAVADGASSAAGAHADHEAHTDFVADDAEVERDELGRAVLAIGLARRLHKIWRKANQSPAPEGDARGAFVVHLDAPWGGGKTSFANYLARVLNPDPGEPAHFLAERYPDADLGGIFLDDPPPDEATAAELAGLPSDARRPWIVIPFNAWQAEHCAPPWWVFYQSIRKGCFRAIRTEGDAPWAPRSWRRPPPPWRAGLVRRWRGFAAGARARSRWFYLVSTEYLWRLTDPKILSVLVAGALGTIVLVTLWRFNVLDGGQLATWLPILSAGLAGLWGLAAFFTESIAPGTASVADRLSMGAGDPFARFRTRFARMMKRVRRPVMVVVDDLDRCRPDFVVDLIRGIQTLLRTPRVVFVILGDRDWIERAFEAHHSAMSQIDVGPEQSFGARFVEKAIQMSFILPAIGPRQASYVRKVLLGADMPERRPAAAPPLAPKTAARVRETVNREAAKETTDPFETKPLVDRVFDDVRRRGDDAATAALEAQRDQVEQMVGETLAIRAATDERVEREVIHQLEMLAACFPDNPRQIKRIVNAITIYHAVALQRPGVEPHSAFRLQLALWIIIMTEWPRTWRLLAAFPDLVDLLAEKDERKAKEKMKAPGLVLPGPAAVTEKMLAEIRADPQLMALVADGGDPPHPPLQSRYVRTLAELTPLHSRTRRLPPTQAAVAAPADPARAEDR